MFCPLRLVVFVILVASACSDDSVLAASLAWQLRCPMGECGGYPARSVSPDDEASARKLVCRISDLADGSLLLDELSVTATSNPATDYALVVRDVRTSPSGGPVLEAGCSVVVQEDDLYQGACSGENAACALNDIQVDGRRDNRTVRATLVCAGLIGEADVRRRRDLVAPDAGTALAPIAMEFRHCQ